MTSPSGSRRRLRAGCPIAAGDPLFDQRSEAEASLDDDEGPRVHEQPRIIRRDDASGPDQALLHRRQDRGDVAGAQESDPRHHLEDVEAVVGQRTLGGFGDEPGPLVPGRSRTEAALEVRGKGRRRDAVEQPVADPVRLDHAVIERVGQARARRDEPQVRPRAFEGPAETDEIGAIDPGAQLVDQRPVIVTAAVAQRVRRGSEACEEQGAGDRLEPVSGPDAGWGRREDHVEDHCAVLAAPRAVRPRAILAATIAAAQPPTSRTLPTIDGAVGAVPLVTTWRPVVMTAPTTRTLATVVAGLAGAPYTRSGRSPREERR